VNVGNSSVASKRPLRSRKARRRIALALALCWIAGFELLPWAHVAMHGRLPAHHHDANGATIFDDVDADAHVATSSHASSAAHDADEADHHDDDDDDVDSEIDEHGAPIPPHADDRPAPRRANAGARLAAALAHGQHSLAHHSLAIPAPSVALHEPLPVDRRPVNLTPATVVARISVALVPAVARGPPVLPIA
jgi:hypothetical protein